MVPRCHGADGEGRILCMLGRVCSVGHDGARLYFDERAETGTLPTCLRSEEGGQGRLPINTSDAMHFESLCRVPRLVTREEGCVSDAV